MGLFSGLVGAKVCPCNIERQADGSEEDAQPCLKPPGCCACVLPGRQGEHADDDRHEHDHAAMHYLDRAVGNILLHLLLDEEIKFWIVHGHGPEIIYTTGFAGRPLRAVVRCGAITCSSSGWISGLPAQM